MLRSGIKTIDLVSILGSAVVSVKTTPRAQPHASNWRPESPNWAARAESPLSGRGTAEQWIKEGKYALDWTRFSCHRFAANQVRLQLFILAYNLGDFLRRLALPEAVKEWSLRTLQVKLVKTGGRLVCHARRLAFQLAEVAVPREVFQQVLERIGRLCLAPT
jgi:hypothetical protein